MTRYKITGLLNILLGSIQITYPLAILTLVLPKIIRLYAEFNAEMPSFITIYLLLGTALVSGSANLLIGYWLLTKNEKNKKRYFKFGLVLIGLDLFLLGLFLQKIAYVINNYHFLE